MMPRAMMSMPRHVDVYFTDAMPARYAHGARYAKMPRAPCHARGVCAVRSARAARVRRSAAQCAVEEMTRELRRHENQPVTGVRRAVW